MGRKRKSNKVPKVHKELEGLDLRINEFGEIISNIDIDKVNEFLTKEVPDKKLINRRDDAYQQEFKKLGLGGEGDEDEDLPTFDESTEDDSEDEDIENILGDEELPPEK
jgi:hypothetical protein